MKEYKLYYPYPSNRDNKKFMVLKSDGRWLHFGDKNYKHFTEGHLDDKRRILYEKRSNGRDKDIYNYDTAGFWSYWYLWKFKTYEEAYKHIRKFIFNNVVKQF